MGIQISESKKMKRPNIQLLKAAFVTSCILLCLPLAQANTTKLVEAKRHFQKEEYKEAHKSLNEISLSEQDPKRMALIELFRGIVFYEQQDYNKAIRSLDKSVKLGTRLPDVAYYYSGMAHQKLSNNKQAQESFKNAEMSGSSDYLNEKSQYHFAELVLESGDYNQAKTLFKSLERKMRGSENYPDILWALLKINHRTGKRLDACLWARKLYTKYPIYEPVMHWGLRWSQNLVDGKTLGCKDTASDQKSRIKRLQLVGASDKAFEELNAFQKSDEKQYTKDVMMAEYLINEGIVREALDRLLPYYQDKTKKKDFDFLGLLGKAASRAGEYQTAIGIYTEAANTLNGSDRITALYRAAFLCYQHQDYDGAIRRFNELSKKYSYTSLGKQANWYIAWLYYLKGNYQKSYDLLSQSIKGRKRLHHSIEPEKVKYWMAMSLLKLGNKKAAQDIFLEISQDEHIDYYSIASIQRLRDLMGHRALASVEHKLSLSLHENWLPHFQAEEKSEDEIDVSQKGQKTNENFFAEWGDLPYMQEYLDMENPTSIFAQVSEPVFRTHIERAKDLSIIGMRDLAKWELYSIEGRTKNKDYLKTLMFEYHRNEVFHRSSYIGTRHFGGVRTHLGLHLGASIWQFVYPRAYESDVLTYSKNFGVPAEFIWSIMKAETNYRPDAISPVGAQGLMQVMTHTGRKVASLMGTEIGEQDLLKPHVSVQIGSRYLQRVLKKFKGKIPLAAAAYNGGPHRVHQWLTQFGHLEMDEFIEHIPFLETRNYVKKVVRYYTIYNLLYNKNAEASAWLADLVDVHLEGTPPTRETWEVL